MEICSRMSGGSCLFGGEWRVVETLSRYGVNVGFMHASPFTLHKRRHDLHKRQLSRKQNASVARPENSRSVEGGGVGQRASLPKTVKRPPCCAQRSAALTITIENIKATLPHSNHGLSPVSFNSSALVFPTIHLNTRETTRLKQWRNPSCDQLPCD